MLRRLKSMLGVKPPRLQPHPHLVVLVTGCDSGLGFQLAKTARRNGLTVVAGLLGGGEGEGGRRLAAAGDRGLHLVQLDVTREDSVQAAKQYVEQLLNDNPDYVLHAVVNNAGVLAMGEFEWQSSSMVEQQLAVNVGGAWRVSRAMLGALRGASARGSSPRLVNVGSHCALQPLKTLAPYSATKAAMRAWSEALRMELRHYGVHVINYIPGSMVSSTNLVTQQAKFSKEMRSSFNKEQWSYYGDYFERFTRYVNLIGSAPRDPDQLEDPVLEEMFISALLEKTPSAEYLHEPLTYTVFYILFRISPMPLRYWLVEKFMRMPLYAPPKKKI